MFLVVCPALAGQTPGAKPTNADNGFARFAAHDYLAAERAWEDALTALEGAEPAAGAALRERIFAAYVGLAGKESIGDPLQLAASAHLLGAFLGNQGHYADAARSTLAAFRLRTALLGPEHADTVDSEANLALAYTHLGMHARAIARFEHVLALRQRDSPDSPATADVLVNLATLHSVTGSDMQAVNELQQALPIQRRATGGDDTRLFATLTDLGALLERTGEADAALEHLQEALNIAARDGHDAPRVELPLANLARLYLSQGRMDEARAAARHAARIAARQTRRENLITELSNLSALCHAQDQPGLAIVLGKLAVNLAQRLRQHGDPLPHALRLSAERAGNQAYRRLAMQLFDAGREREGREVLGLMRDEEYLDFIGAQGERRIKPPVRMSATERAWAARIEALLAQIRDVAMAGASGDALDRRFDAALDEAAAALPAGPPEPPAPPAAVVAGSARIEYLMLPDRLRVAVYTSAGEQTRELPVREARLLDLLRDFRARLQDPSEDPRTVGKALYALLLAPVESSLAGQHTLILSLDGALRYIPFAALHDGERYLAERFFVRRAVLSAGGPRRSAGTGRWRVAAMGVTRALPGFAPLPHVREELDGIVGPFGLPGEVWLDRAFTAQRLASELAGGSGVLHLASHFHFSPASDREAYLLLGDGSRLSLHDIRTGPLRFDRLHLLTLSACDSALTGGRDASGREIDGLAVLSLAKGARQVLATLWPVDDRSTAVLMRHFYHALAGDRPRTDSALRQAQLTLLHGANRHVSDSGGRLDQRLHPLLSPDLADRPFASRAGAPYAHPYYWAPFILIDAGS